MANIFIRNEKDGIVYYTIPSFTATGLVVHSFSGRRGGVSQGPYEGLNLSILTQDQLENVLENRCKLTAVLNIAPSQLVGAHQVHQDYIYRVTEDDRGKGAFDPVGVIPATDALMTDVKGIALTAFFADCVPVFFLDPVKKAVALAHAGWKGTVMKIAARTVSALEEAYGSKPRELLAAIGPSIGACHYEVDTPVIEKVKEAFPDSWEALFTDLKSNDRGRLNLWEANALQLREAGVPAKNITIAGLCTYCRQDEFFSHRAGMAGRQAALLMLR